MVTITLCTRQQKRHRCIEQSYGSCDPQKSPDTPGSPEGNTEGPGTASSAPAPAPVKPGALGRHP